MSCPLISVILPVFNGEKYIKYSIESVLSQTYENVELIVVNDGSTDKTSDIVEKYCKIKKNIKKIDIENSGMCAARNEGIKNASGDYISFIDHDDIWLSTKLQKQIKLMQENKKTGLVSCETVIIDFENNLYGWKMGKVLKGDCYDELKISNWVTNGSVVLVRKECFDDVGLFDENISLPGDWDICLRIAKKYEVQTVPEILVCYRISENASTSNVDISYRCFLDYMKRFKEKELKEKQFHSLSFSLFCQSLIGCNVKSAWKYLLKSFSIKPFNLLFLRRFYLLIFTLVVFTFVPIRKFQSATLKKIICFSVPGTQRFAILKELKHLNERIKSHSISKEFVLNE